MRKNNSFNMIIDDMKNNLDSSNKVGLEYKVKFIIYVLISIYALCYAILSHFDDDDDTLLSYKILYRSLLCHLVLYHFVFWY